MSRTLSDVLHEYAVNHHARIEEIRAIRQEWVGAVQALFDQCRRWLEDADKDKVLQIQEHTEEVGEERLGRYPAPVLVVRLGNAEVTMKPGMRMTSLPYSLNSLGPAFGSVSVANSQYLSYYWYRLKDEQGSKWIITYPERSFRGTLHAEPLTRESFDQVMASLLG